MNEPSVILEEGKEKAVRNRHHWIFSGAVRTLPDGENGSILPVRSSDGELLGHAYFNRQCSIIGRMLSFGPKPPLDAVRENLRNAVALRRRFFDDATTNAYRLVNGEGDNLPGLTVDRYHDVLVLQVATLGMEKLKPVILEMLADILSFRAVVEKSNLPSRAEEGLPDFEGRLYGKAADPAEILENGIRFIVEFAHSQKTGFFLDQREMRRLAGSLARGKKVLDCFAYTAGFSVYALRGGAERADVVEISAKAMDVARKNFALNGFDPQPDRFHADDVFEFLRQAEFEADFIILDPPAFAKKKTDIVQACRGYKDINRLAMKRIATAGLLLTFSCSHFVDEALFQKVVFEAAREAGRSVRILQKQRHAFDHPVNIYHPESHYLKGFLLYVE